MGGGTATGGTPVVDDPIKQWIVMRKDLNMRKGKMIAQGAHASMAFMSRELQFGAHNDEGVWCQINMPPEAWQWIRESFTKICLYVESDEDLVLVHERALEAGLVSHLITDNGTTEFGGVPTRTCCAIGPDYKSKVYPIVGHLPLL